MDQKDVEEEFESYFSDIVCAIQQHNNKFVEAMEVLKEVIALEKDTLNLKHKVANFTIDYDDDLDEGDDLTMVNVTQIF